MNTIKIIIGNALTKLCQLPNKSIHCCVTSPPYYGLRDYGTGLWEGGDPSCDHKPVFRSGSGRADGVIKSASPRNRDGVSGVAKMRVCACGAYRLDEQLGLEETSDDYISQLVKVFREVRRILHDDGVLWLNIGDSYASGGRKTYRSRVSDNKGQLVQNDLPRPKDTAGIKPKDLLGIPWRVAFALQNDGWYLRQDIIWSKPNSMPESVTDRCTKSHEYLFLLTKSVKYHFNAEAIAEPLSSAPQTRDRNAEGYSASLGNGRHRWSPGSRVYGANGKRNKRSVWEIATEPFFEAHFATFPEKLVEPCIRAGCPKGGTVLDPFFGAGTVGLVSGILHRDCIGIELNPKYVQMALNRINKRGGFFYKASVM